MPEPLESQDAPSLHTVDLASLHESRGWFLGIGIVFVVLGFLAVLLPYVASLVTAIVLGWLLLIAGVVQAIHAIQNRRWHGSGWALVAAALQVIAGVLVVAFPISGTLTLTLVLAAFFIAHGIVRILRAVQHRTMSAWGWLLFDGIVSLIVGALIWLGWPSTAVWALGLLVGIDLIVNGASLTMLGLAAGTRSSAWRS